MVLDPPKRDVIADSALNEWTELCTRGAKISDLVRAYDRLRSVAAARAQVFAQPGHPVMEGDIRWDAGHLEA